MELSSAIEKTTRPARTGLRQRRGNGHRREYFAARFNRPVTNSSNYYIYAIVSDGDLMEGVASEAASMAGHLKLAA